VLLTPPPLVLDLDGTVIRTDTFHEMMLHLLYKKPWLLLLLPFWLLKGRSFAKARLVAETELSPPLLPYNPHILHYARKEAKRGRRLILATGTHQKVAQAIANHLGIFQEVIGSDAQTNMTGLQKQKALLDRFGPQGFDYAGDSRIDAHIWKSARFALVVHPKWGVFARAKSLRGLENVSYFPRTIPRFWAILLALRPLFWVCTLQASSWALCIALSFLASGLLIVGDLVTLYKERAGSFKQSIFAEGHLHLTTAFILAPLLVLPPLVFFPSLLLYLPLFVGADIGTRERPQPLRWGLLSLLQLLSASFFLAHY
jgi:hypothetical protein